MHGYGHPSKSLKTSDLKIALIVSSGSLPTRCHVVFGELQANSAVLADVLDRPDLVQDHHHVHQAVNLDSIRLHFRDSELPPLCEWNACHCHLLWDCFPRCDVHGVLPYTGALRPRCEANSMHQPHIVLVCERDLQYCDRYRDCGHAASGHFSPSLAHAC